jgi:hypothetical protein
MSKVTMPLMSGDARGKLADAIVFSYWKGRNYVRIRIIPKNPKEDGQAEARLYMGSCGKNDKAIESLSGGDTGDSVLYTQIIAKTPSDQSWHSYFMKTQIGMEWANIKAARTAWTALGAPEKLLWTTAAATIPITGFDIGYGVVTPITGGEQLFISATGGWLLGLAIVPADPSDMIEAQINAFAAAYKA